jgi:hypothetical protein
MIRIFYNLFIYIIVLNLREKFKLSLSYLLLLLLSLLYAITRYEGVVKTVAIEHDLSIKQKRTVSFTLRPLCSLYGLDGRLGGPEIMVKKKTSSYTDSNPSHLVCRQSL